MNHFALGEQPKAAWFPLRETWTELMAMQVQRDAATGVYLQQSAEIAARSTDAHLPRPVSSSFAESVTAFTEANDAVLKARIILQNPDLLTMALKQDSEASRSLADLCAALSQSLSMGLDENKENPYRNPPKPLPPLPA